MNNNEFIVKNDKNEDVICNMLHHFTKNNINYIIYTDYEINDNGELNIMASKYTLENNIINLIPIENDEEWDLISKEWSKYENKE